MGTWFEDNEDELEYSAPTGETRCPGCGRIYGLECKEVEVTVFVERMACGYLTNYSNPHNLPDAPWPSGK
jgi:hypothetical protein